MIHKASFTTLTNGDVGEYLLDYTFINQFDSLGTLKVDFRSASKRPTWLQQRLIVNDSTLWENDFANMVTNDARAEMTFPKYNLTAGLGVHWLNRFLYVDQSQQFVQADQSAFVSQIDLKHSLKFKKFHLDNYIYYQNTAQDYLALPNLMTRHHAFYLDKFFKNRLLTTIGVDVHIISEYDPYEYQPLISSFYESNQTVGTYNTVDFYTTIKVQRFKLFAKFENVGNLFDATYLNRVTPSSAGRDYTFRFGIDWGWHDKEDF